MKPFRILDLTEVMYSVGEDTSLIQLLHGSVTDATVVSCGQFTDEEIAAFGGVSDVERSPWLSELDSEEINIATREARRNLAAEGQALFSVEGAPVELAPAISAFLWSRSNCDMMVIADTTRADEIESRCLLYRISPKVFLMELIGPLGYHEVSYCSRRAAAEWLASISAREDGVVDEAFYNDAENESPTALIQRLEKTSVTQTLIYAQEPLDAETQIFREVSVFDHDEGNWLCEYMDSMDGYVKTRIRKTGIPPLVEYLTNYLGSVHDDLDQAEQQEQQQEL